jgi:PAS domain S-box-containing protein
MRGIRFGLAFRLATASAVLSGILLVVFGWLASWLAETTLKKELGGKLASMAKIAAADEKVKAVVYAMRAGGGAVAAAARVRLNGLANGAGIGNLMVVDGEDRILADARGKFSFHDPVWLLRLDRAELKRVWKGQVAYSPVYQGEDGGLYLSAYAPLVVDGEVRAVVGAEASAAFLRSVRDLRRRFAEVGAVALALAALLGWMAAQTITRPLRVLRRAVERVERGEFTATAQVDARDEVGELARAFNRMAQAVNVRHELMLESMTNGLVAVDEKGSVVEVNGAAERLLGLKRDGLLGRRYSASLPAVLAGPLEDALSGGEPIEGEKVALDEGGQVRTLQVSTSPLKSPDGVSRGAEIMFLDVTEVERLTGALEAQKRFVAIGEMAAEVAHQIRNPLAAILFFADLLKKEIGQRGKSDEFLRDLLNEVRIMEGIVGSFLAYARPQRLDLKEVRVEGVVAGICRSMQDEFARAGVRLENAVPGDLPPIRADENFIQQVFGNLLRNALEACVDGGRVAVSGRAEGTSGVRIAIEDDGSGIPDDIRPRLFMPFVTSKARGTGLGLSLAKKYVEAHGGTISLVPLPKGARAEVFLPMEAMGDEA